MLICRQMREQPELDLRVVRRQEQLPFPQGHKATANLAPEVGAHGNVLQVRVR